MDTLMTRGVGLVLSSVGARVVAGTISWVELIQGFGEMLCLSTTDSLEKLADS